jgi:hypothetical protein
MGKNPRAIPADYHRRAMKELFRRAELQLQVHLPAATKALTKIATGERRGHGSAAHGRAMGHRARHG